MGGRPCSTGFAAGTEVRFVESRTLASRRLEDEPYGGIVRIPQLGCIYVTREMFVHGRVDVEERVGTRTRQGLPGGTVKAVIMNVPLKWIERVEVKDESEEESQVAPARRRRTRGAAHATDRIRL